MVHSCCLLASWSASEEVSSCCTCGERGLPGRPRGTFSRTRAASTVGLIPASGRRAPSLSTTDRVAGDALSVLRLTCSSQASGPHRAPISMSTWHESCPPSARGHDGMHVWCRRAGIVTVCLAPGPQAHAPRLMA